MNLKPITILPASLLVLIFLSISVFSQNQNQVVAGIAVNYNEDNVGIYTLPDPLLLQNREKVINTETWTEKRRPEILELYKSEQFGKCPDRKNTSFKIIDKGSPAFNGAAIRKQVTLYFTKDTSEYKADLLLYLPVTFKKPAPVFLMISFMPNSLKINDPGIKEGTMWTREGKRIPASEGKGWGYFDVEKYISEGIGVATIYYGDIEPDFAEGKKYGIRGYFLNEGETWPAPDEWGAILNMQEFLWDGIKRDRLVWLGDFHPELKTITTVFGYNEVVPKSLDLACKQYPLPNWMNGMSSYSMWYLIIHHDWYMQNADLNFLKKHKDYIIGLIDLIDSKISEDGTENLSRFRFLDWPSTPNREGVEAGYRALLLWSLKDAEELCNILGEEKSALVCKTAMEKLNRIIMPHNNLKQAAALMTVAGTLDPEKACREVIAVDGAKRFSTFYGLYMLDALSMAGMYEKAIEIASNYWGGMLDMGATTFWEDFNVEWKENSARLDEFTPEGKNDIHGSFGDFCYPSYRHSFCHGWASGVTSWLTMNVLGVKIVEPGCKTLKIEPYLGNLQWVEGTYPTPLGIVKIKHTKLPDGKIETKVDAPEGIKII